MIDQLRSRVGDVLVVGTGLIGTSIGLALRRAGVTVWLSDTDPSAVVVAADRGAGAVLEGDPAPSIVVVAVPPDATAVTMRDALARWPEATVTDVASVKAAPLSSLADLGGDMSRVVGGHPMAGRETSGPLGARVDLFADRRWVLTPTSSTTSERLEQVRAMATLCGAVVTVMEPDAHDRAVALTSHVPQAVASLVAARLDDAPREDVAVSGQGLRDVTRIAASDPVLWTAILEANAVHVAAILDGIADDLEALRRALREGQGDGVRALLDRGNKGRARIPGKHGDEAAAYAVVSVMVADEPGELARLFDAARDATINLEDVRIDHLLGRPSGLVELSVRPEQGDALIDALRARGFDARS